MKCGSYDITSLHCLSLILTYSLRVPVWCQCISLWSAMQKRRCIGLTRLSIAPAFPRAVTTVASTCTQRPGLPPNAHGAPLRSPATSPSSSLKTLSTRRRPAASRAHHLRESPQLPAPPLELDTSCHRQVLELNFPTTIPSTLGRTGQLQHPRPCPCPHHPLQCHPHTITHICAWAPLHANRRRKRKFIEYLFLNEIMHKRETENIIQGKI